MMSTPWKGIDGATAAVRSRETVTRRVIEPLRNTRAQSRSDQRSGG